MTLKSPRTLTWIALVCATLLGLSAPAGSQPLTSAPPHVAFVEGSVQLERAGVTQPLQVNEILVAGDRLDAVGGRVEIFLDGATLYVDRGAQLGVLADSDLWLDAGRIAITVAASSAAPPVRVEASGMAAELLEAGHYRLAVARSGGFDVEVQEGWARIEATRVTLELGRGERVLLDAGGVGFERVTRIPRAADGFQRWTLRRRAAWTTPRRPARLPVAIARYAGVLDLHGRWGRSPAHGDVWYPSVPTQWRPYWDGRWTLAGPYGWTWVGFESWAWPTHHYGRWGLERGRWFWVPGPRWAPAWVLWGFSGRFLAWSPLGVDNRPVRTLTRRLRPLERFDLRRRRRAGDLFTVEPGHANPWRAWTIIAREGLGERTTVRHRALDGERLPGTAPRGFLTQHSAPSAPSQPRLGVFGHQPRTLTGQPRRQPADPTTRRRVARPPRANPTVPRPGIPTQLGRWGHVGATPRRAPEPPRAAAGFGRPRPPATGLEHVPTPGAGARRPRPPAGSAKAPPSARPPGGTSPPPSRARRAATPPASNHAGIPAPRIGGGRRGGGIGHGVSTGPRGRGLGRARPRPD